MKNYNKVFLPIFTFLICLSIFFSGFKITNVYAEDVPNIVPPFNQNPVPTTVQVPSLVMTGPSTLLMMKAGETKNVSLVLKNIGTASARSLFFTSSTSENVSASISDTTGIASINAGSSQSIPMRVSIPQTAEAGTSTVTVNFTYFGNDKTKYDGTGSFMVKIDNPKSKEVLSMNAKELSLSKDNITQGESFSLNGILENTSTLRARNVNVVLDGLTSDTVFMENNSSNLYFESFDGKASEKFSFALATSKKAKTGSYPITINLKYKDVDGKDFSDTFNYYVKIDAKNANNSSSPAGVSISSIVSPSGVYDTGEEFNISFVVQNNSSVNATNVKISHITSPEKEIVPKSSSTVLLPILAPGESKKLNFSFTATSKSISQNYSIGFLVEYENGLLTDDDKKETTKFEQYAGVNIINSLADKKIEEGDGDKLKNVPKIIVSNYTVSPLLVQAGTEFDLSMTFKNTHADKQVKNIKAILTVPEAVDSAGNKTSGQSVFSPVNSSNTFYLDGISPKSEKIEKIKLYCVPDAAPKNYVLNVQFEYEDEAGNPITAKEEIGVNVRQIARLEIGEIKMPTTANIGNEVYLEFSLQNTGKVPLNNFKVKFVGEGFDTSSTEVIFGNFTSGNHEFYSASFTPTMAGDQKISFIVSYDEDTGEHIEKVTDYNIKVEEGVGGGEYENPLKAMIELDKDGNPTLKDAKGKSFKVKLTPWGDLTYENGNPIELDEGGMPIAPKGLLTLPIIIVSSVVGVIIVGVIIFIIIRKNKKSGDL